MMLYKMLLFVSAQILIIFFFSFIVFLQRGAVGGGRLVVGGYVSEKNI